MTRRPQTLRRRIAIITIPSLVLSSSGPAPVLASSERQAAGGFARRFQVNFRAVR